MGEDFPYSSKSRSYRKLLQTLLWVFCVTTMLLTFSCSFIWNIPEREEVRGDLRRFKALLKMDGTSWSGFAKSRGTKKDTLIRSGVCAQSVRLEQAVTSQGRSSKGHRARVWVVCSPISSGEGLTQTLSSASMISTSKDAQRPLDREDKLSFCA